MEMWPLLAFTLAITIAGATPGPTIITLVARVLAGGRANNVAFAVGLVIGDIAWLAAAVFGVAAIATYAHEVMTVLRYLGAAYLAVMAYKMWTAPLETGPIVAAPRNAGWRGALGGLGVALSNPKTMMFYLALVPNLIDVTTLPLVGFVELAAVITVILSAILAVYIAAAERARRLFRSPRAMRGVNRGASAMMAGCAVVVATRS
jgi:threonine/homoserine/homoserine lactone efflux protein